MEPVFCVRCGAMLLQEPRRECPECGMDLSRPEVPRDLDEWKARPGMWRRCVRCGHVIESPQESCPECGLPLQHRIVREAYAPSIRAYELMNMTCVYAPADVMLRPKDTSRFRD